jgi:glutamine amidotransferase/cyclase
MMKVAPCQPASLLYNYVTPRNAIKLLDFPIKDIVTSDDILSAEVIIFPGQGNFRQAIQSLRDKGWVEALRQYVRSNRPFFGICLGMQLLFEGSEESPGVEGLGLIPGMITKFDSSTASVPQIGWNGLTVLKDCPVVCDTKSNDMVGNHCTHSACLSLLSLLTVTRFPIHSLGLFRSLILCEGYSREPGMDFVDNGLW